MIELYILSELIAKRKIILMHVDHMLGFTSLINFI